MWGFRYRSPFRQADYDVSGLLAEVDGNSDAYETKGHIQLIKLSS